ncbi:hypothetical protein QBC36DRAFT_8271 [Triangularia setosa]|uniref:Uncharacterized protein n=1 Tax=Triangularia setosa TaxID=2587417 RepID=A0AAN6W7H8_9PEZI|nr:hypothetical protein QBC36DRAFT_8271 [Podospora setosa]
MSERKKREASLTPVLPTLSAKTAIFTCPISKSVSLTPVRVPGKATPYLDRSRSMSMPPSSSPLKNMVKQERLGVPSSSIPPSGVPSSPLKTKVKQGPSGVLFSQIPSSPVKGILKSHDTPQKEKTAKVLFAEDEFHQVSPSFKSLLKKKKKKKKDSKADKKNNKNKSKSKGRF